MSFTPYDYLDRFEEGHSHLWDEAMEAKFHGVGKSWDRKDFDRVTKDFDARRPTPSSRPFTEHLPVYPRRPMLFLRRGLEQGLSGSKSHPQHAGCRRMAEIDRPDSLHRFPVALVADTPIYGSQALRRLVPTQRTNLESFLQRRVRQQREMQRALSRAL